MSLSDNDALEVERIAKRIMGAATAAIAALKDGTLTSDGHRVLNFQGAGVTVADDPTNRRTNIIVPGAPVSSTASNFPTLATSAFKMKSLWNGTSNDAPPANWQTVGFSDAAWTAAVLSGEETTVGYLPLATSHIIWVTNPGAHTSESALLRHTFTLPAGTVSSASILIAWDTTLVGGGIWVNGTFVSFGRTLMSPGWVTPGILPPAETFTIPPGLFTAGGSNVIALQLTNDPTDVSGAIDYILTVNSAAGGADTRYQLLSEKDAVSGYAGLNGSGLVAAAELGSGTPSGSNFLRGDRTWAPASTNSIVVEEVDASPSVAATTLQFPNGTLTSLGGGVIKYTAAALGALSTAESFLGADVTMTTVNTFYDGPSISLGAGTWLIMSLIEFSDTASAAHMTAKLWNGTTVLTSGQTIVVALGYGAHMALTGLRTIASGTETWKISGANGTNSTSGRIKAAAILNGAGNNATSIRAIQIA